MIAAAPPAPAGRVIELLGPVVRGRLTSPVALGDVAFVGDERLIGEVVAIDADVVTLQVYESMVGIAAGAPLFAGGRPLSAELGPGLLGGIFDGLQRPLPALAALDGDLLHRGRHPPPIDRERRWRFTPVGRAGDTVRGGELLGTIEETPALVHRVLVPPSMGGLIVGVADAGEYRVTDTLVTVERNGETTPIAALTTWPARVARPYAARLSLDVPLITGQRVLDTFFPVPIGGTVGMPGGFGTGKTVMQQQLCKWARADVIVFIGCGERGNEMADVLEEFPRLVDPRTGRSIMDRTVLVVNTSNMPVAAREASIYVGATIAEYYRDMGYRVAVMADSLSRWAEALREISSALEEMPGEEGYPTYLASRLAGFFARAGMVETLDGRIGSLTLMLSVSPPGGDFTEPVTQACLRAAGALFMLDSALAHRRHFPAIDWFRSFSLYESAIVSHFDRRVAADWSARRQQVRTLLQEEARLREVAEIVGTEGLQDTDRRVMEVAEQIRRRFLMQNAYTDDAYSSPEQTYRRVVEILERQA